MTKVKRVNTSNDAGALAMSPNVRAMRCDARRESGDARTTAPTTDIRGGEE